jgi:hypothetical protein
MIPRFRRLRPLTRALRAAPRLLWSAPFALAGALLLAACGPKRVAVVGPAADPAMTAERLLDRTVLPGPTRIDFSWTLNEQGSRVDGVGVARVEPPYRARLDLFLDNGETVVSAAVVEDELRLPPGAPDDVLPPVDLMWGVLGVFRPIDGATLDGGDRLENGAERLRYRLDTRTELHFEVGENEVRAVELLEGGALVQWVRLDGAEGERFPASATYRNLVDFRELVITRKSVAAAESFDPSIWDPR